MGLLNVCSRAPVVASNRYADPESVAPVSSLTAPIRILSPEIETEFAGACEIAERGQTGSSDLFLRCPH